jgi:dihydropteroate synthase
MVDPPREAQLGARVLRLPRFAGVGEIAGGAAVVALSQLSAAARHALPAFGLRAADLSEREDASACVIGPVWAFEAAAAREGPARATALAALTAIRHSQRSPRSLALSGGRALELPCIMGIVNITPDSFSDGGDALTPQAAAKAATSQRSEGAKIVDLGAESTRPAASQVSPDEELARLLPAMVAIRSADPDAILSVDTLKAPVAARAVEAGAAVVNDVSGLAADPAMADTVAKLGVPVVIGHRRGDARTMQSLASYDDVVAEVFDELADRIERARRAGIAADRILVDPGLGFAKTAAHNWEILGRLGEFRSLGHPIVVGPSRKSFLGELLGGRPPKERDDATLACVALAAAAGAAILRVHRVKPAVDALTVVRAAAGAPRAESQQNPT